MRSFFIEFSSLSDAVSNQPLLSCQTEGLLCLFVDRIDLDADGRLTHGVKESIVPGGIQIGEITAIEYSANGLTKTATVKPYVNFNRLEEVFILMNSRGGNA